MSQFEKQCLDVMHAQNTKDFSRQIVNFANGLGFRTFSAVVVIDHSPTLTEFQSVTNAPSGYLQDFEDLVAARSDPVSQHCKVSAAPIIWDQKTYVDKGRQDYWDRQAIFGYRSGISLAMHLPKGLHFFFGVDSDSMKCESPKNLGLILGDLQRFVAHAQAAAFELCLPTRPDPANAWLLARSELEALRWTSDGRSAAEIGKIMALSETDVTLRLHNAMRKLECSSKYETVVKAIRLGLIHVD
jgi:DNA-binding CsgD family transcriptional regulator